MGISRYQYLHYDVFTDRRFEGNQLAVFPDAIGLSARMMQQIAREIGFAETTFVTVAEGADTDVRMRIFTPGTEMPMAGHPVVGSTFALARAGRIAREHRRMGLRIERRADPCRARVERRWVELCLDDAAITRVRTASWTTSRRSPERSVYARTISGAQDCRSSTYRAAFRTSSCR